MKCVQNITTKEVRRVSEDRALELFAKGTWKFVPKSMWKEDPHTTWMKNNVPDNPMSDSKTYRLQKRAGNYDSNRY